MGETIDDLGVADGGSSCARRSERSRRRRQDVTDDAAGSAPPSGHQALWTAGRQVIVATL